MMPLSACATRKKNKWDMPACPHTEKVSVFESASAEELRRLVDALHHVHRLIAAMPDLYTLLLVITEESRLVARAEASSLLLYDPVEDHLYFHVALGDSGDQEALKRSVRLRLGQGIAGVAAKERQSILVKDVHQDPRFYKEADKASRFETRNLIATPMIDRDELVGVLEVVNKVEGGEFTPLDIRALEMFSSLAASAIVNARLIEEKIRNERLAAIGHAVAVLSHHTKNIISGMSTSADLIDMGLSSDNVEVLRRAWPVFKRSTKRIMHFVQDMLSFSKPREPLREWVELYSILQDARESFQELYAQVPVEVTLDCPTSGCRLHVDAQAIFRAILNLLTNAAEACGPRGGKVHISAHALDDNLVEIIVADTGPGIPDEIKRRVFEPFFSTKGSQGTGLGLAVTRKSILEHKGTITLEDNPGGGALFRIHLPRDPQAWPASTIL